MNAIVRKYKSIYTRLSKRTKLEKSEDFDLKRWEIFSPKWLKTMGLIAAGNLVLLLLSRFILGASLSLNNYLAFIGLSLAIGLVSGIGAFGLPTFFFTFVFFDIMAMVYAYFIIIVNRSSGWEDLTSMAGFMVTLILGFALAVVTEIFGRWRKHKSTPPKS